MLRCVLFLPSVRGDHVIIIIIIQFVTNVKTILTLKNTIIEYIYMCDRNKEQNFHPNYYLIPLLTICVQNIAIWYYTKHTTLNRFMYIIHSYIHTYTHTYTYIYYTYTHIIHTHIYIFTLNTKHSIY